MREKLFLLTSKSAAARLTSAFDFVWPTAAAIWNLRWQVAGYLGVNTTASQAEVSARFISGSGIRGANLRRACIDTSWEDQKQEFSRFLLVEFCALYETWCEGALAELGLSSIDSKSLQFPTKHIAGIPKKGIGHALARINATPSPVLTAALYPLLCGNRKYSKAYLENLLICYRYFKELRNALVHAGGTTSSVFISAQTAYTNLTPTGLGVTEVPEYITHAPGDSAKVSLRGVTGFGEIVLRLICTLDAELVQTSGAEQAFVKRWKAKHGNGAVAIPSNSPRRQDRIRRLIRQLDLPLPNATTQLDSWLRAGGLIT